ncbi:helix-turn-helix domain-containing protein [Larkinella sp. VNQ87]|uniref:AraC family transcriptional regulator n=1 Tax=Larkinella sp. VNQ87 TaxID=3400921 RepID=UPI003C09BE48
MLDPINRLRFNILHIGRIAVGSEWQFDGVVSPFSRLYLILDGEAWVYHQQQRFTLKPGHLYLIPSFTYSRYHCDTRMEQYYISFLEETDSGISIFQQTGFQYETPAKPVDTALFERLLALNEGRSLRNIDPKAYDNRPDLLSFNQPLLPKSDGRTMEIQGIMLQLISRFMLPSTESIQQQNRAHHQLSAVLSYIHTHLDQKLTVEELAARQHQNVDYFSRQFQSLLGVRPIDYIINKRLERAQLLMTTSSLPLQAIAEQVGIADIYYFSRLFKRRFGIPPGQYRKTVWLV